MNQPDELLFEACRLGDEEAVEAALLDGAEIDAIERGVDPMRPEEWRTPLSQAAFHGRAAAFERLLRAGADAFAHDCAALAHACAGGSAALAEKLLRKGSDPDARSGEPLSGAMEADDPGLVRCLLAFGANPALARWAGDPSPATMAAFGDRRLRALSARRRAERGAARAAPRDPLPPGGRGVARVGGAARRFGFSAALASRLASSAPEVWARFQAGAFPSLEAAAIEAGLRPRRLSVPVTPEGLANAAKRHLDKQQIKRLGELLATAREEQQR